MTAANKYSCRLDGADKYCINDPLEAEGGKVRRQERTRRREEENYIISSMGQCTLCHLCGSEMTVINCLNNADAFQVKELEEDRYLFQAPL